MSDMPDRGRVIEDECSSWPIHTDGQNLFARDTSIPAFACMQHVPVKHTRTCTHIVSVPCNACVCDGE
jgi:hypothetical protein